MGLLLADVVALALALVARITEVSCAPTEPLRDRAAEATFKLDEVLSVRFAVLSTRNSHSRAGSTNQLLWLEDLFLLLSSYAVLFAAEICVLALETLVVGEFKHSVGFFILEVWRARILQWRVVVHALELDSLFGLLPHFLFEARDLDNDTVEDRQVWRVDLVLLASRTVRESKSDAG